MKLALVADIHANLPALQAVLADVDRWRPDLVVVLGDIVNRGPHPRQCLDLIRDRDASQAWHLLAGNHEDYVLHVHHHPPSPGPECAVHQHTSWTARQLDGALDDLAALPPRIRLDLPAPAGRASFTHASLLGNRNGIFADTGALDLAAKVDASAALFGVGHTHRPLVRNHGATVVVNAGSVGLPFDGDRRAGYARATARRAGWEVEIQRLAYDWRAVWRDCVTEEFVAGSGPVAGLISRELEVARPLLTEWTNRYQHLVLAGQIGMERSVREFLAALTAPTGRG